MYIPCMYVNEQCTNIVHTCYIHVYTSTCTWYNQLFQQVFVADTEMLMQVRDIPQLSHARDNEDQGSPCPEDGDFFYARSDAAEKEEAISKFISGLESQEQAGFDRLHTLLSRLPVPVATNGSKMSLRLLSS